MKSKWTVPALIGIIILGAALRIWGIRWGLPSDLHYFSYHPDETRTLLAATAVSFKDGQLDPGFYNYGSLFVYLTSIAIDVGNGWGWINLPPDDIFSKIGEFAKLFLAGRIVAVILGIATVCLVYALARRAYGRGVGLLAALVTAIIPLHVMHAKFLAVDVPATFFVVSALIFAMRITEGHRLRDYLLAGLFAGLAAGTKYNAGVVIIAPVAAHFATHKARFGLRSIHPKLWAIPLVAAAGFLISTPGAILNTAGFRHDFGYEVWHSQTGHGLVFADTSIGFVHHFTHSLWMGMGLPLLSLSCIGILYSLYKRKPADIVLLSFLIAYYVVIGVSQVKFARYTIPILPVLAVLAARASVELVGRLESGRPYARTAGHAVVLVLILIGLYTTAYTCALNFMMARTDTRDIAARWIWRSIPTGSSIGLPTIPWFYTPPVDPLFGLLTADDRLVRVAECTDYQLVVSRSAEWDADLLRSEAPEYVILSRFEYGDRLRIRDRSAGEYFDVLRSDYRLERRFAREMSLFGVRIPMCRALPHDMSYASPTILIYSRKAD